MGRGAPRTRRAKAARNGEVASTARKRLDARSLSYLPPSNRGNVTLGPRAEGLSLASFRRFIVRGLFPFQSESYGGPSPARAAAQRSTLASFAPFGPPFARSFCGTTADGASGDEAAASGGPRGPGSPPPFPPHGP